MALDIASDYFAEQGIRKGGLSKHFTRTAFPISRSPQLDQDFLDRPHQLARADDDKALTAGQRSDGDNEWVVGGGLMARGGLVIAKVRAKRDGENGNNTTKWLKLIDRMTKELERLRELYNELDKLYAEREAMRDALQAKFGDNYIDGIPRLPGESKEEYETRVFGETDPNTLSPEARALYEKNKEIQDKHEQIAEQEAKIKHLRAEIGETLRKPALAQRRLQMNRDQEDRLETSQVHLDTLTSLRKECQKSPDPATRQARELDFGQYMLMLQGQNPDMFRFLDADHDGNVTPEEFEKRADQAQIRLDAAKEEAQAQTEQAQVELDSAREEAEAATAKLVKIEEQIEKLPEESSLKGATSRESEKQRLLAKVAIESSAQEVSDAPPPPAVIDPFATPTNDIGTSTSEVGQAEPEVAKPQTPAVIVNPFSPS